MNMNTIKMNTIKMNTITMNPLNTNSANMNLDAGAAAGKMAAGTAAVKAAAKGEKAARDFESMLLGSVFDSLEKTFTWDSDDGPVGSSAYRALATKSLAAAVSASGGIGIARFIQSHLTAAKAGEKK
jgi:Rod binding domain-containing protein